MTGQLPTFLEDLQKFVQAVGGKWTLVIALTESESIDKAGWLADAQRDFFSVTPAMQAAMKNEVMLAFRDKLERRDFRSPETVLVIAAEAARQHILKRFERGGFDVRLKALSPMWLRYKAARGWDHRVGIAQRGLLNDVKAARFSFVRAR